MEGRTKPSGALSNNYSGKSSAKSRRNRLVVLGLITAILVTLVLSFMLKEKPEGLAPKLTTQSQPAVMPVVTPLAQQTQDSVTTQLTKVDYQQLVLKRALRWTFDDIILAYQQQQLPLKPQLVQLSQSLGLKVSDQNYLLALFARYRDYQLALIELKKLSPAIDENIDIAQSYAFIERLHDMQYDYFNETEIAAFFAQDNAYDMQALARVSIRQDSSLGAAHRQALLEHQISQLTEPERQALVPSLHVQQIAAHITEQLSGQSLTPLDMSPEVGAKVEAITQAERQWRRRVREYQGFEQQTIKVDTDVNRSVDAKVSQGKLQTYLQQHFSPQELKRLQVFLANPSLLDET